MTKIHIKTPTSEYVIEDAGFRHSKVMTMGDADTGIPGLPIEPGMGSGHKLEGNVANEAPIISTSFKDKEIRFDSGKLAIIDAALLDAIEHPLEKKAIVVPVKSNKVTFLVSGTFDDSVLNKLVIEPKVLEDGDMEDGSLSDAGEEDVVIDPDTGDIEEPKKMKESLVKETATTGHDNFINRQMRKASGSINQLRHDSGEDPLTINTHPIGVPGNPGNRGTSRHHTTIAQANQARRSASGIRHVKPESNSSDFDHMIKESVESFLNKNLNKTLTEDKVRGVENRKELADTLHTMMAMASAGWESENGNLVHPLGVTISEGKWKCKDGCLVDEKGNRPSWDFDWAYNSREVARGE